MSQTAPPPGTGAAGPFDPTSLSPGEVVCWTGRPNPAAFAQMPMLWAETALGCLGVPFSALFYLGASKAAADVEGSLASVVVVALALLSAASSLYFASVIPRLTRRARRLHYAVTNQRVIIAARTDNGVAAHAVLPEEFSAVKVIRRGDGSGSVRLRKASGQRAFLLFVDIIDLDNGLWAVADLAGALNALQRLAPIPASAPGPTSGRP